MTGQPRLPQDGREGLEQSLNRQRPGSSNGLGSRNSSMILPSCHHWDERLLSLCFLLHSHVPRKASPSLVLMPAFGCCKMARGKSGRRRAPGRPFCLRNGMADAGFTLHSRCQIILQKKIGREISSARFPAQLVLAGGYCQCGTSK